jgi:hypothetical protein
MNFLSIEQKSRANQGIVSQIGGTVLDIIKTPFDFTKDVINIPFRTVSGITTKVVLIVGLGMVGLYFLTRPNTLKTISKALPK